MNSLDRYLQKLFPETSELKRVCDEIVSFRSDKPVCLILVGSGGEGKSFFADLICAAMPELNWKVKHDGWNESIQMDKHHYIVCINGGETDLLPPESDTCIIFHFRVRPTVEEREAFHALDHHEWPHAIAESR